jgi:uncharacterized protein (DUF302 family)
MMETNKVINEIVSLWDFEKSIELLIAAAEEGNWMIPAIHDLKQSLARTGKEVRPVKVLEVCKPQYSGKMLEKNDERIVSVLMPCRISVYLKEDGKTYISIINISALIPGLPESVREVMMAAAEDIDLIVDAVVS